jgi:hypothetical protein
MLVNLSITPQKLQWFLIPITQSHKICYPTLHTCGSQKVKTAVVQVYYTQGHKIVDASRVSLHRYTII